MAKKIDVHVHVGEDLYRRYTPEMALERMDRNDIEFAVISPVPDYPTPYGIKSSAQQNDYIAAALQKYPDRFVRGLGVVNPRHGMAAVPEVDRIFGELGLSGLMFSNDKTGLTMDNPTMIAFFEHAMRKPCCAVEYFPVLCSGSAFYAGKNGAHVSRYQVYQWLCLQRFDTR